MKIKIKKYKNILFYIKIYPLYPYFKSSPVAYSQSYQMSIKYHAED